MCVCVCVCVCCLCVREEGVRRKANGEWSVLDLLGITVLAYITLFAVLGTLVVFTGKFVRAFESTNKGK